MDSVMPYVLAIVPSIGVGFLFYVVIKAIIEGDRNERLAQSRWEAEQAASPGPADRSDRADRPEAAADAQRAADAPGAIDPVDRPSR